MPRTLPWLQSTTPSSTTTKTNKSRIIPRSSPIRSLFPDHTTNDDAIDTPPQSPSTSNAPQLSIFSSSPVPSSPIRSLSLSPRKIENHSMKTGFDMDDRWKMVEDELLSTAKLFTSNLRQAEYLRLKKLVSRNEKEILRRREEEGDKGGGGGNVMASAGLQTAFHRVEMVGKRKRKLVLEGEGGEGWEGHGDAGRSLEGLMQGFTADGKGEEGRGVILRRDGGGRRRDSSEGTEGGEVEVVVDDGVENEQDELHRMKGDISVTVGNGDETDNDHDDDDDLDAPFTLYSNQLPPTKKLNLSEQSKSVNTTKLDSTANKLLATSSSILSKSIKLDSHAKPLKYTTKASSHAVVYDDNDLDTKIKKKDNYSTRTENRMAEILTQRRERARLKQSQPFFKDKIKKENNDNDDNDGDEVLVEIPTFLI